MLGVSEQEKVGMRTYIDRECRNSKQTNDQRGVILFEEIPLQAKVVDTWHQQPNQMECLSSKFIQQFGHFLLRYIQ